MEHCEAFFFVFDQTELATLKAHRSTDIYYLFFFSQNTKCIKTCSTSRSVSSRACDIVMI
jgi:hypothetical protein